MSLNRWNAKRDTLEAPCVELLKAHGWSVLRVSVKYGPDLVAAKGPRTVLFEVKSTKYLDKRRQRQHDWRAAWPGEIALIRSVSELETFLVGERT